MLLRRWLPCALVAAAILAPATAARAQVPRVLNFQGRLADASLTPLTGVFNATFTLWTQPDGGSSCLQDVLAVPANSGLFNVLIGSGPNAINNCTFADQYYLQIHFEGDAQPMMPRLPLTAAPYALNADKLDGLDGDAFLQQSPATGNVAVSGRLGVGKTPSQKMDVNGYVQGTSLCMGSDCRTQWKNGTVSSVTGGSGIAAAPNPLTTSGSLSLDAAYIQRRITPSCATTAVISAVAEGGAPTCTTVGAPGSCRWKTATYSTNQQCYTGYLNGSGCSTGYAKHYKCTCSSSGSWSCYPYSTCTAYPTTRCGN